MPAADSLAQAALPIGLAHGVRLRRAIARGDLVHWNDVDISDKDPAVRARREMELEFPATRSKAAVTSVS
jgi:predicted homoserine dehydrogenase-like protein